MPKNQKIINELCTYGIEEKVKVIVFAGRLDNVKGISGLINAFKRILTTHPAAHLFILGEGNFNAWLKESSDCWAKITFTGRVDKKKLYKFYSLADMGVVCSLHEEFGFVVIEMMMHALMQKIKLNNCERQQPWKWERIQDGIKTYKYMIINAFMNR